jgi:hypothetical protein
MRAPVIALVEMVWRLSGVRDGCWTQLWDRRDWSSSGVSLHRAR